MAKRKKNRGHFCWVCGRIRPNEKFSGKGHRNHVCRDCSKLGAEELAFRQNVRDLERCFGGSFIKRNERVAFQRFLHHEDPRVRAVAEEFQRIDAENRELARAEREAELDAQNREVELAERATETVGEDGLDFEWNDDEIPF